jgi:hypothetical protein
MEGLDEKKFEMLLLQKRHKEVITLMTKLLTEVSKPKDSEINVEVDTSKLEKIIEKINTAPDFSEIPNSIKLIGDAITKKLATQTYPEPIKNWTHTIVRDNEGFINIVTSKGK